jgi:hypothetical protein
MRRLRHWYHFRPQSTYRVKMKYGECILRVHTEWRLPMSDVHPIMMEKSALAGEGGGDVGPPLFSLLPSHTTGRYTHPISPLSICHSTGAYPTTLYVMVNRVTEVRACTPPHQPGKIFSSLMECTSEISHCHAVCTPCKPSHGD